MTAPVSVVSYATALTARDAATIEAALLDAMAAEGVETVGFGDFSEQRALVALQAQAQEEIEKLRVTLVYAGTATTAHLAGDDWVDVTFEGFFFEKRIEASKATISLNVTAPSTGPASAGPGAWLAQADDGSTLYKNVDAINVPAGQTRPALFECRVAGIVGNAPTGTVTHLVVGSPGVVVTNAAGSIQVAGRDAETSADYLIRCIGKWGTLGKGGNALAYYYWVPKAAPTITRILIRDDNPFGAGTIGVCLANAAGPASQAEVDAVAAFLVPIKPLGSGKLKVFAAVPQALTITAKLYGDGSNPTLLGDAEDTLNALSATYPIGSLDTRFVYRAKLVEDLMLVPGMRNVRISSPSADVGLAPYSVVQFTPALTVAS